jgi:predicted nucleotidyltransferase component of viral defense system
MIEVNYTERRPFYAIVGLPYAPPIPGAPQGLMLRSYDIDEMLGTKMRALLQRDQGRDLFDLWWAWTLSAEAGAPQRVDPDRVVAAFNDYMARENTVVRRGEFGEKLARKLARKAFRSDTDGMLRAGLPPYDVAAAEAVVREVFLSRLAP